MTNNDVAAARPKGTFSWALWDWASQAFPTVVTSFIFGRYITSEFFAPAGYSSRRLANTQPSGLVFPASSPEC